MRTLLILVSGVNCFIFFASTEEGKSLPKLKTDIIFLMTDYPSFEDIGHIDNPAIKDSLSYKLVLRSLLSTIKLWISRIKISTPRI